MYNHLYNASRGNLIGGNTDSHHQPPASPDSHSLNPMPRDTRKDDRRYYRSAEFKQALLEDRLQQEFVVHTPVEPSSGASNRFSRYHAKRKSIAMSFPSLSMLDVTKGVPEDRQAEDSEAGEAHNSESETSASPQSANVPSAVEHHSPLSNVSDTSSEADTPSKSREHRLPRIHLHGTGPFARLARHRKGGQESWCIDVGAGGMCGLLKDEPANPALAKDLHQTGTPQPSSVN